MSQAWRPSYDEPDPPMPVGILVLVIALLIVLAATWVAVMIG